MLTVALSSTLIGAYVGFEDAPLNFLDYAALHFTTALKCSLIIRMKYMFLRDNYLV